LPKAFEVTAALRRSYKSWTVTNPEALKGHEGHEVTLKAHEDAAKNEIHILSVKMGKGEMKESKTKDEMKK
jgi:hypothetical protein